MTRIKETAQAGRNAVIAELTRVGASEVRSVVVGRQPLVIASNTRGNRTVRLRVKTRRTGDWFASIADGNPHDAREDTYWVFVDLSGAGIRPEYYIAPDRWVRGDIQRHHQAYLDRHGGSRPRTPWSDHHAISLDRIGRWKDPGVFWICLEINEVVLGGMRNYAALSRRISAAMSIPNFLYDRLPLEEKWAFQEAVHNGLRNCLSTEPTLELLPQWVQEIVLEVESPHNAVGQGP